MSVGDHTAVPAHVRSALTQTLEAAVPLWIMDMRRMSFDQRQAIARASSDQIAAHGDDLMFGGKECAQTFNALAKGIAALSFCPGGVTFDGRHWESREGRQRRPVEKDPQYHSTEKEN